MRASRIVVAIAITLVGVSPLRAQSPSSSRWSVDVSGGALVEPMNNAATGPALSIVLGHRAALRRWGPSVMLAAARLNDIRSPSGLYTVDRDWRIAALGVDGSLVQNERFSADVGIRAGMLWIRWHDWPTQGTLLPVPWTWDQEGAAILDLRVAYRMRGPVQVIGRVAGMKRVFTDDFWGPSGALMSAGIRLGR